MDQSSLHAPRSYPLPATDIPPDVRQSFHPWIAGFVGLNPADATKRLHQRWSTIDRPSLLALRQTLSEFEVRAIVDHGSGGMIYAVRPNSDEGVIGNSFYLPAAIDPVELETHLRRVSLSSNEVVRDFITYFGGISEDTEVSGHFVHRESPWPTFDDSWTERIEEFAEWKDSLMIYTARDGCQILVHPSGKVAWWVMQEDSVKDLAPNFDDFVLQFNEHRKGAWPYDPYGP